MTTDTNLHPNIEFDENGIPINLDFGDSYYSKCGGLDETRAVFVNACQLPQLFENAKSVVIGETGFGTGLNFLVVWDEWKKLRQEHSVLHFYTFEKFLMTRDHAKKALEKWPELSQLIEKLLLKWPLPINGLQRIWFEDNIALNIVIGDANQTMARQEFAADAWFLDGFAPRANADFWSDEVFKQIKRLSKPNVRIGTYSVAQVVRNGLGNAGFHYAKREGFGTKRERLEGWLEGECIAPPKVPKRIAVIGGGVAGSCLVHSFKNRGVECTIFDDDIEGQFKASNNPRGLFMPRLDRVDSVEGIFFKTAFVYAAKKLREFVGRGFIPTKVKEIAKNQRDIEKYALFKNAPPLSTDWLEIGDENLFHLMGGMVNPSLLCQSLRGEVKLKRAKINSFERNDDGSISLFDGENEYTGFDHIIIANGVGLNQLLNIPLPIGGKKGQISLANIDFPDDEYPMGSSGYCIPIDGKTLFGATFDAVDLMEIPSIDESAHARNLDILKKFAPEIAEKISIPDLKGRASIRVVSKDKMPIVGKVEDGVHLLGALGSRGFSMAPILAELVVCDVLGEPLPMEQSIVKRLLPNRFFTSGN